MPSPSRGNWYMLVVGIFSLAVTLGMDKLLFMYQWDMPTTYQTILFQVTSLFVPFVIYCMVTKQPLHKILPSKSLSIKNVVLIIAMTICMMPMAMLLGAITSLFVGNSVSTHVVGMFEQPFPMIVLSLCVVPAIFEEMTLRGVVLYNYSKVSIKKAALMNGLLFGLFHMQLEQFLYAFLLGTVFTYFVYHTRSIWASVLAHFCFNFIQLYSAYAAYNYGITQGLPLEDLTSLPPLREQLAQIAVVAVFAIGFSLIFWVLLKVFIQSNRMKNMAEDFATPLCNEVEVAPTKNKQNIINLPLWLYGIFYVGIIMLSLISAKLSSGTL